MEEMIAPCGDNCSACPRYMTNSEVEWQSAAKLWHKLGWTDAMLSPESIKCSGCCIHHFKPLCSFSIIDCLKEHNINKCNQCSGFPCAKIDRMLDASKQTQEQCKKVCSEEEYLVLHRALFCKEENLRK